jgi:hypothetical protein
MGSASLCLHGRGARRTRLRHNGARASVVFEVVFEVS